MRNHRIPDYRTALRASLLALTCALAGCVSDGQGPTASVSGAGPTIAFESIDGPPPQVFDRMVGMLDSEAKLRNVAVVSREAPAAFHIRSYLAAQVQRGRTSIAWVWDVYDRNQQRALRLSGEEPATGGGRDAWAAADDVVLRYRAGRIERPQQRHYRRSPGGDGAGRAARSRRAGGRQRRRLPADLGVAVAQPGQRSRLRRPITVQDPGKSRFTPGKATATGCQRR
jgi:hypothetical protein